MSECSNNSSSSEEEEDIDDILVFKRSEAPLKISTSETELASQRRNRSLAIASASLAAKPKSESANQESDDVDDTDGLDPEQELKDWQSRERSRVEREFKEIQEKEARIEAGMRLRAKRAKTFAET